MSELWMSMDSDGMVLFHKSRPVKNNGMYHGTAIGFFSELPMDMLSGLGLSSGPVRVKIERAEDIDE